tara:strand:- start:705 stop:2756 length:2052 start_codon:yes stop_codon:yes gene_type:complete
MSSGDIFYSNVDTNLRKELQARANAGFTSRTNDDLNFMLGKIANVEAVAYDGNDPKTKKLVTSQGASNITDPMATLGGSTVTTGSFLPSGPAGFVTAGNSFRIPPVITSAEINIGDHTMGLLNKAALNITIPDPVRDLDNFERIWFRPGRHSTIIFEYPDSAVITSELLTDEIIPSEEKLAQQFPEKTDEIRNELKKMNRVRFDGLITSFQFTYQQDGSVECTLSLTGTSNVYTDVTTLIVSNTDESGSANTSNDKNTGNKEFINLVKEDFGRRIKETNDKNIIGGEIIINESSDRSIIWGPGFTNNPNTKAQQSVLKFISLGHLVDLINENLVKKNTATDTPVVVCNDSVCRSNYYPNLVSADPSMITLWQGTQGTPISTYGDSSSTIVKWLNSVQPVSEGFYANDENGELVAFPSRIYINIIEIEKIFEKTNKLNDIFISISELIYAATGGAINMSLITHPSLPSMLLYYDTKYLGNNKSDVSEFVVPMFAQSNINNQPGETVLGTIVTDVKISSKLPDNLKNLAYVLNDGTEISESDIAPFVAFMYADEDQREKLSLDYKKTHEKYIKELEETKVEFANDPKSTTNKTRLSKALIKYIQYPTDNILDSNQLSAPIYPFDIEFTINGINGFKYGDVLEIPILPSRYSTQTVFSVINVVHSVDSSGLWETKIKCIMRPRITN